ncbi:Acyl transferase domain-containing protein [Streptoalloteichus tenebrarius]|uniref:Acyl transferase domain-containing protein n=1 Tax=Streptoalloteichus tenebrarius (strain ATCC 17920 / DSM 40477 / JCM 4838 / CBS 697.72 / NBRC 16177 / NCIMB 11028 / NRRL B-12390 / A12253. 1 / ISP 5477) TaxID=1933 RepID=A0ABT1HU51_STRSD|nr:type I polyketide synthase [Streptoalloteichus tenebrarius]MCP2259053.1 Acyl transferase domain-containing protein [Streptoalloteichus tenebrarius]BFE99621.1 type I polyketide synthase [Streptoalloteichus tenebrarius]
MGHGDPRDQDVAIVGMACRFPGARNRDEFLRLLTEGADAVGELPAKRWELGAWWETDPDAGDSPPYRWGGFLDDVEMFDSGFFRVSPARADRMDPQQRLLLETSWEAFEDAGWRPEDLAGSATGVFVGVSTFDYGTLLYQNPATTDGFAPLACLSVTAANLSHYYDLRGPSLAVDTACSSSLVALHQAVRSLRAGECEQALVCGSNLILEPQLSLSLSRAGMLSKDGRCKSFGAGANGYVRAEGVGVLLLRLLSDARAKGDRCYALVRGTATNQDGRTDAITAPSPVSQMAVIRSALADAELEPEDIDYVECHGTGTAIGDVVEAKALSGVLRPQDGTPREPLPIGSVKSNIGHAEAASGVAGLMKAVLMLHHRRWFRTLHSRPGNPEIDFDGQGLRPVVEGGEWRADHVRRIGLNSFGFGGSNAHAVIQEAPAEFAAPTRPADDAGGRWPLLVPVSARSAESLRGLASQLADHLDAGGGDPAEVAHTLGVRRSHHPIRAAVTAVDADDLVGQLRAVAEAEPRTTNGRRPLPVPRVGFVFTGQGNQFAGMARGLLDTHPVFADVVRRCDEVTTAALGWSVSEHLRSGAALDDTALAQPALFAVQAGLTELWRSLGVAPVAVVGHSSGEVAAAYAAGCLTLEQGIRLSLDRGAAMARTAGMGRMLAVGLPVERARELAERVGVSVAAVNAPSSTVLSGDTDALTALRDQLQADAVFARFLPAAYPFHSPMMSESAGDLAERLSYLDTRAGDVPFYSTVDGKVLSGEALDADYWHRNMVGSVLFQPAVESLVDDGVDVLLEIGPEPVLSRAVRETLRQRGEDRIAVLNTLRPDADDRRQVLDTLAELYVRGADVAWEALYPEGRVVALPPYPWNRRRHWIPPLPAEARRDAPTPRAETPAPEIETPAPEGHPLLGQRLELATVRDELIWQHRLDTRWVPEFLDHVVAETPVLPGVAHVEALVAAGRDLGLGDRIELRDVEFHQVLLLDAPRLLQVTLRPDEGGDGGYRAQVHSRRAEGSGRWTLHATGVVDTWRDDREGATPDLSIVDDAALEPVPVDDVYAWLGRSGLRYGPHFAGLRRAARAEGAAVGLARVEDDRGYHCDPRLLDTALQLAAAADVLSDASSAGIPVGVRRVRVRGRLSPEVTLQVRLRGEGDDQTVDAVAASASTASTATDAGGFCAIEGVRFHTLTAGPGRAARRGPGVHALEWRVSEPPALPASVERGMWLLVADRGELAKRLAAALREHGQEVVTALPGATWSWHNRDVVEFDPERSEQYQRLVGEVAGGVSPLRGVVFLSPVDLPGTGNPFGDDVPTTAEHLTTAAVELLRATATAPVTTSPSVWVVTRNAQPVREADPAVQPHAAPLRGLVKAAQFEIPTTPAHHVDLDPAAPAEEAVDLVRELLAGDGEGEVGLRGGQRFTHRLTGARPVAPHATRPDPEGVYVITGGTGGLGLAVARRLVERGARRLALLARSATSPRSLAAVEELTALGAEVELLAVDCADRAALAAALDTARRDGRRLRGVVHAAGVLRDQALLGLSGEALREVMDAKVRGGWNLHELTGDDPLDWFVLFSSAASAVGSPGQANYCAANAFLDALAHHRRGAGQVAQSVNWGPWSGVGMAATASGGAEALADTMPAIAPEDGVALFESLLASDEPQAVVLPFGVDELVRLHPGGPGLTLLGERRALPAPAAPAPAAPAQPAPATTATVTAAGATVVTEAHKATSPARGAGRSDGRSDDGETPRDDVEEAIAQIWREAFGVEHVGVHESFFDLGGDSVFAYQILTQVARRFGVTVDPEDAFQEFTIAHLAQLVARN